MDQSSTDLANTTPINFQKARKESSGLNITLIIAFIVLAVLLVLMNLQAFVWWRKAKHSTCWISFTAITNCVLVSSF